MDNLLIFEKGSAERRGVSLPSPDVPERPISELVPARLLREAPPALPEVAEPELVRHYTTLSQKNFCVDGNFYPLGSCTMKYNPKLNEDVAAFKGFNLIHPLQPEELSQGALQLMYELEECIKEISGLSAVSLQPAAGAQGELAGMLMIGAYHEAMGAPRKKVIIPDSAHGTNPASARLAGFDVVEVKSNAEGLVDLGHLREMAGPDTAGFMLTVPNTLGLFESDILEISGIIHDAGGLMYMDGANMNALVGLVRPGDMGFDVVHFNMHKTFSTPHGGGGPGAGPVGVSETLVPFLPTPTVEHDAEEDRYYLDYDRPQSIGRIQAYNGNFGVLVRAYAYIRTMGAGGMREISESAIINANYLLARLKGHYRLPHERHCMHEVVFSGHDLKKKGVHTMDVAKRLLDFGFHAPTVYFPLVVDEAIMIEPTETESKQTLDAFSDAMIQIAKEAEEDPEKVTSAPHDTPLARLDETEAARHPVIRYRRR